MTPRICFAALLVLCLIPGTGVGRGAVAQNGVHAPASAADSTPSLGQISRADYLAQLAQMQALVDRCQQHAELCDPRAIPEDATVDNGTFAVHWYWLRDAVEKSRSATAPNRTNLLQAATERLTADAAQARGSAIPAGAVPGARAKANEILSRTEFRHVDENSYLAEKIAALYALLDKVFSGAANYIPRSPWIATALEWGVLALAASALLLWAWRLTKQQRLVIAEVRGSSAAPWQKESENWAERARNEATRGEWREAVHCLYWSAIVLLEGQKLWRQNRARTPREYLRLLEAGSDKQRALGGLTRIFERIWYGLRPAAESDYRQASSFLEKLRLG